MRLRHVMARNHSTEVPEETGDQLYVYKEGCPILASQYYLHKKAIKSSIGKISILGENIGKI